MLALRLNTGTLWLQVVLALAFAVPILLLGTITGTPALDGLVGGLLGLYICSHPARNTVDALFADRFALRRISATWAGKRWLALNGLALLAGWGTIWLGMVSLVGA